MTYFEDIGVVHGKRLRLGYAIGYILSLALTYGAYEFVVKHLISGKEAILALATLALLQFLVQMRFFLHLDFSTASRERLFMTGFALVIVLILVSGSVWILWSLDSRMMPSMQQMMDYINTQPGI